MDGTVTPPRGAAVVLGGGAVGLLLAEGLRVWLPSVLLIVGDAGSTSALGMGAFALGVLGLAVVAGDLAGRSNPRWWWVLGGLTAVLAMLGLRATQGGGPQAVLSTAMVVGAGSAVGALAVGARSAADARTGTVLGVAASAGLQATLGTIDLTWRTGAVATLGSLTMAVVAAWAMAAASRELTSRAPDVDGRSDAVAVAWPWLVLAPALTLLLLLVGPAGRAAVALGTTGPLALVAAVAVVTGVPVGAVLARARPGPATSLLGAGLVTVGAAGALDAAGGRALASQAALALGLGLVVGGLPEADPLAGGPRAGRAAGAGLLGLGVLVFAYYAPYDLTLPFNNRGVPLAAAAAMVAAVLAGLRSRGGTGPSRPASRPLALVLVGALVLATPALLAQRAIDPAGGVGTEPTARGPMTDGFTVLLANVRMGYDEAGHLRVTELAGLIDASGADVVVLNEVDRGWVTTGSHDVGAALARATGMTLLFAPAADEVWGNAVLTRLPVREVEVERLPRGTDAMARSVLVAVLALDPAQDVAVIGTHLSHVDRRGDTRLPQAQAVAAAAARMRERGIPTVVAGDLNAEPGAPELLAFSDLVAPALPPGRPTHPAGRPTVQIDHVLVSPELVVGAAEVLDARLSDHRFVRVGLRLDGTTAEDDAGG